MADPPRRVNFFEGQLLTTADLAVEQEYHRGMRYLLNRLHGYGTVSGLEVVVSRGRVRVSPGLGIDVLGREIVVTAPLTHRLEPHRNARRWVRDASSSGRRCPRLRCPARTAPSTSPAGSNDPSWCSLLGGRHRRRGWCWPG
jgi:hypothetical protein